MKTIKFTILLMLGLLLLPVFAKADLGSVKISGVMGLAREIDGQLEVITVDRWESQYRQVMQGMFIGETPAAYVQRAIEEKIRPINSTFASRLDEGLTQVLTTEWVDSSELKTPNRVGRIKGNYERAGWKVIQLLERKTEKVKGKPAKVSIRYNRELFQQLHSFDISLLLMHETIYMLNSNLKQNNSYEVRKVVAKLMAENTLGVSKQSTPEKQRAEIFEELHEKMRGLDLD